MRKAGGVALDRIDLHAHTAASDGSLAPRDLVREAAARGVGVLAITDHDTVAGVREGQSAGRKLGVRIVPGIELNCDLPEGSGDDHADILGYFVDIDDADFARLLAEIQAARRERARRMVERLQELGADVTYERVAGIAAGGAVGRPHVARALVESGFVDDTAQAFRELIGRGRPAYADRYRLTPEDACRRVRDAGGVPGLAHPVPPARPYSDPKRLRFFLEPLVDAGLGALECFYPGYTARVCRWLVALADFFGLVPTGGSDFHGPDRPERALGTVDVPPDSVERLERAAEECRA